MYKLTPIENSVCAVDGFFADGISAGLKKEGKKDVAFIYSDTVCDVAHLFTTNKMQAAPLRHFRKHTITQSNFVLINAKNANAMTGDAGLADIEEVLSTLPENVQNPIMSSTGVIGVRLPKEKIKEGIRRFDFAVRNGDAAAEAIMTTDAFRKSIAYEVETPNGTFKIGAIAKGAGMINPAMATMLCFITTDIALGQKELQKCLNACAASTFNAISVDGDTSTNDTVLLLSSKKSACSDKEAFIHALFEVMLDLAKKMARDGEGATKLVTFEVNGALNDAEAEIAAKALSNSLLVKTALFGQDPNWGRIASTVGASGVHCSEEALHIAFDDIVVYSKGSVYFNEENEAKAAKVMRQEEFTVNVDLGQGEGFFTAYGCDLGYEYIKINADYRT